MLTVAVSMSICSGVSNCFVCIGLMGMLAPSLHRESTNSLIHVSPLVQGPLFL